MVPNPTQVAAQRTLSTGRARLNTKNNFAVLPFLIPALTIYVGFLLYPIINAIGISFYPSSSATWRP